MSATEIAPIVASLGFLGALAAITVAQFRSPRAWLAAASASAAFAVFSVWTVAVEGPVGFWALHTKNFWGNQVWTDLLMAAAAAYFLILPRARTAGMRAVPWLILIVCTGSIGLYAMLARLLWIEGRQGR